MKKFFTTLFVASAAMVSMADTPAAQIEEGDYYAYNVETGRYMYVVGNKGMIWWDQNKADFSAMELWGLDSKTPQDEATAIIHVVPMGNNQYNLLCAASGANLYEAIGMYATIEATEGGYLVYAEDQDQPGICRYISDEIATTGNGQGLVGGKGARVWAIEVADNTPTAIQSVAAEAQSAVYTITGARVNGNQLSAGIYVKGGSKVMVR